MQITGWLEQAGLENLASNPTTGLIQGRVYYNTNFKHVRVYLDSVWRVLATLDGSEILSNKTIEIRDDSLIITDQTDTSKKVQFELSGVSPGVVRTLTVPNVNGIIGLVPVSGLVRSNGTVLSGSAIVSLSSDVSGVLPIGYGGTGEATAAAAFGALSPLTTKGDLQTFSTLGVRLPVGVNGQTLQADSTQTTGLKWGDGSAGGSGELNMVSNPSASSAVTPWAAAGGTWANPTRTTTSGDLPLENQVATALKLTSPSSALAEASHYVGITMTPGDGLKNKKLKVEFYMRPGTNFVASEWTVSVYSGATRMSLSTDASGLTYLPNATGKFTTTFDTDSSSSYTLRFARTVNAGTNAAVLNVTNVIVGPGIQPQGAVVGEWQSYTPVTAGTGSKVFTNYGKYRRVGDSVEIRFTLEGDSTAAGAGASGVTVSLPSGLTIDATKTAGSGGVTGSSTYGMWQSGSIFTASQESRANGLYPASTTTLRFFLDNDADVVLLTSDLNVARQVQIFGFATLPITEWSGSGTLNMAQNDVEYASNSDTSSSDNATAFVYGSAGSSIAYTFSAANVKTVQFQTPIQTTDLIILEVNFFGDTWVPLTIGGHPDPVSGGLIAPFSTASSVGVVLTSDTADNRRARVSFGRYRNVTADWATLTTGKWRVRKVSGGQAVGFGMATATQGGLVKGGQVPGSTSGTAIAAGYIGEQFESNSSWLATNDTLSAFRNVSGTITVTAGVWLVSGVSYSDNNVSVYGHVSKLFLKGANSGVTPKDYLAVYAPSGSAQGALTHPPRVVIVASGDTKTFWVEAQAQNATSDISGYIVAVRIA